jgi:hypothetical protein
MTPNLRHETCTDDPYQDRSDGPQVSAMQRNFQRRVNHRIWKKGLYSCDINRSISGSGSRGPLKKLALVSAFLIFVFQAQTSQLAFIVLNTGSWASGRLPSDWMINVHHGKADLAVCDDGPSCLHLKSVSASFALEHSVDVDPLKMPWLTWHWKVARLPEGGDFRRASTDDQAAQVLVAFDDKRVLTYIWDTSAPKGAMQSASHIPLVRIYAVVCQSGPADANKWIAESRNVAADYERGFGKPAPRVKGLRLQINSQHTGSTAESYFGEVAFRSTPQ